MSSGPPGNQWKEVHLNWSLFHSIFIVMSLVFSPFSIRVKGIFKAVNLTVGIYIELDSISHFPVDTLLLKFLFLYLAVPGHSFGMWNLFVAKCRT